MEHGLLRLCCDVEAWRRLARNEIERSNPLDVSKKSIVEENKSIIAHTLLTKFLISDQINFSGKILNIIFRIVSLFWESASGTNVNTWKIDSFLILIHKFQYVNIYTTLLGIQNSTNFLFKCKALFLC